ncbi:TIGR01244 family sulfur transferase [Acetobacter tropicalis]|uniref:Oxidoreductase n=3 Tax=Acetobacter TaxID=434 RepID=A0A0U5EVW2_9PROT|nr:MULTISPECIES: TIGR01244 family sulfur transferase [Acetobacter]ATJ91157.1 TIGR01244 family protein [Acetobacter tropicalis]KXV50256.1 oxidoreductase [Acetobacter tropicalis]KXV56229.1 oxidoreductase [Acetobacter tropicalis]KXV57053.1 oxidoreductase [Acetobacter senegalensis]MCG4252771.1 TIGR01244 family phosphatase [Acetobacter senegalensis]
MTHYRSLTADFAVAPQISTSDIPAIKDAGFKTVICTRPDGEEPGQPSAETIGEAARAAGLAFISIPVAAGHAPSSDAVIEMQEALNTLPGPVFSYCRSGNRAGQLWTLATQG